MNTTVAIVIGDALIAFSFFMIGRSTTRIKLSRAIKRLADKYRREAFDLSDKLTGEWSPAASQRIREKADNLLGKAEALCDLVDQV